MSGAIPSTSPRASRPRVSARKGAAVTHKPLRVAFDLPPDAGVSQRLAELFRTQLLANAVGVREGCSPDDPLVVPSTESRRPAIPGGILLWARNSPRSQGRNDSSIAHSITTRAADRRAGASRSLPSKDTGRGVSPPWP